MANDNVKIEVDVPSRVVAGSVAVALALFTVEALTNIFKHAFPNERAGVIRVTMETRGRRQAAPGDRRQRPGLCHGRTRTRAWAAG